MEPAARQALLLIRRCLHAGRYGVLPHFTERMDLRGLFWPDVQSVLDAPSSVQDGGIDKYGRPKWIVSGRATDGLALSIVCALDVDDRGHTTVFITAYWE
jgi:hypothetical protein